MRRNIAISDDSVSAEHRIFNVVKKCHGFIYHNKLIVDNSHCFMEISVVFLCGTGSAVDDRVPPRRITAGIEEIVADLHIVNSARLKPELSVGLEENGASAGVEIVVFLFPVLMCYVYVGEENL